MIRKGHCCGLCCELQPFAVRFRGTSLCGNWGWLAADCLPCLWRLRAGINLASFLSPLMISAQFSSARWWLFRSLRAQHYKGILQPRGCLHHPRETYFQPGAVRSCLRNPVNWTELFGNAAPGRRNQAEDTTWAWACDIRPRCWVLCMGHWKRMSTDSTTALWEKEKDNLEWLLLSLLLFLCSGKEKKVKHSGEVGELQNILKETKLQSIQNMGFIAARPAAGSRWGLLSVSTGRRLQLPQGHGVPFLTGLHSLFSALPCPLCPPPWGYSLSEWSQSPNDEA